VEISEKIDILLVDDRPDNFTVLEAVLNMPNYNLVRATSGFEAIRIADQMEFAVILMDVQMPGKDGFETAREIRRQGKSKNAPIIFVTAIYGDEAYVNLGYDAGAVDYIFKPFNPHILKSKVAVLVDLFLKTRKLVHQSERLRDIEKREHANKLLDVRIKGIQREQALQQKYKDLVDSIDHCIVWSINHETMKFTFVSPQAEKLTGYKTFEWTSGNDFWLKLLHPEDSEKVLEAIEKAKKGEDVEFEKRLITKEGKTLWFHTSIHLGEHSELRGLSIDVTSLKKAELTQRFLAETGAQLAASALDYDKILAKITEMVVPKLGSWCGIHMVDENGKIKTEALSHEYPEKAELVCEFEKNYQMIFGKTHGMPAVIGTGKPEVVSFENIDPSLSTAISDLGLRSYICVPMVIRERVLGTITIASTKKDFQNDDLTVMVDLARRAALAIENALLYNKSESAIQTRDEFLSIASHELRTPLTPLKLQFQITSKLIKDGKFQTLTPEKLKKMMETSDRQLNRLNTLIDELLSVSRINLGRMELYYESMDLSQLIRNVAEQYKDQLESSSCELSLDLDPTIKGEWDPSKLEQVIVNLLTNSIKYGQGKPIRIQAASTNGMAHLTVQDFGIGIDDGAQKKIFDLFERAPSAKKYGGMGLGLFVVNNIVKKHGGTIRVESKLDQGTTFILELPKKPAEQSKEAYNTKSYLH
jgi:PAS domain S-box-containing protein